MCNEQVALEEGEVMSVQGIFWPSKYIQAFLAMEFSFHYCALLAVPLACKLYAITRTQGKKCQHFFWSGSLFLVAAPLKYAAGVQVAFVLGLLFLF